MLATKRMAAASTECSLNFAEDNKSIKNYVERAKIFFHANFIPEDK